MGRHLIKFLLFTGVIHVILSVPRKYYLIQLAKTWNDAQTYCQANYEDLAVINSDDNLIRLQNEIQQQQFTSNAWIGMFNDISSWRWSLGNEPLVNVRLWAAFQPNNYPDDRYVWVDSNGWLDDNSNALQSSVCFDNRYSGNDRYIFNPTKMTWLNAQSYCRQYHTDLASTRDINELQIIHGKRNGEFAWIGLFRDSWKWTDGTNLSTISFIPWIPTGYELCAYQSNGQASDAKCSDLLPFLCYSIITGKKQHLRLKLVSSQDLNDPAVQATILEKIKQKLLDHGLAENTMVKWRTQPRIKQGD